MAFLGSTELIKLLRVNPIIVNEKGKNCFEEKRIEQAAYTLTLGAAYRTDNKDRSIETLDESNKTIEINPGQFSLLLTKEIVDIPQDKLAFISIKAKYKLKGLVNVSGFHVDPCFKGKLIFSVYNAGPSTITLEANKPYFLIWFSTLQGETTDDHQYVAEKNTHQGQMTINVDYIDALKKGDIASPNELLKQINENKTQIKAVETSKNLKNEKLFWIFSTILALITSLNIIYWNRNSEYKNGYNDAIKETELIKLIEKGKIYEKDSLNLHKIDSLINRRLEERDVKTK